MGPIVLEYPLCSQRAASLPASWVHHDCILPRSPLVQGELKAAKSELLDAQKEVIPPGMLSMPSAALGVARPSPPRKEQGQACLRPTYLFNLAGSLGGNKSCFPAKTNPQVEKEKNLLVAAKRQAAEAAEAARQAELALRGQAVSVW